ncbi:hypothetical protein BC831DRAFT_510026 [Entophlyctis helioformis]|nr:hypothetical protein BC831DRAFT_510026 [Entophlyctis helioformis]
MAINADKHKSELQLLQLPTDVLLCICDQLDAQSLCRIESLCRSAHAFAVANRRPLWLQHLLAVHPLAHHVAVRSQLMTMHASPLLPGEDMKDAVAAHYGWHVRLPALVSREASLSSLTSAAAAAVSPSQPAALSNQVAVEHVQPTRDAIRGAASRGLVVVDSLAQDADQTYITTRYTQDGAGCLQAKGGPISFFHISDRTRIDADPDSSESDTSGPDDGDAGGDDPDASTTGDQCDGSHEGDGTRGDWMPAGAALKAGLVRTRALARREERARRRECREKLQVGSDESAPVQPAKLPEWEDSAESRPWPPIFRSFRSNLIPINAGKGFVSLWDPVAGVCVSTFKAIEDPCQGQLVDNAFLCFNLQWSSESSVGRVVNCWDVTDPRKPVLAWSTRHPHHVVDVAVNAWTVAIAFGTFVDEADSDDSDDNDDSSDSDSDGSSRDEDSDASRSQAASVGATNTTANTTTASAPPSSPPAVTSPTTPVSPAGPRPSPFSVELRCRKTGSFLRRIDVLTGIRNILCLNATRFHLFVLRATHDGTRILVVDLQNGSFVSDINLMRSFIRSYGGVQISANERLMILWSTANRVAVIDVIAKRWRLFGKLDDEAASRNRSRSRSRSRSPERQPLVDASGAHGANGASGDVEAAGDGERLPFGFWVLTGPERDLGQMTMHWKAVRYP